MKSILLTFVRHGETLYNRMRLIQGQAGGELTELGCLQACALAERISRMDPFDMLCTSDLKRALQTSRAIVAANPTLPILIDKRLREKGCGVLEGKPLGTAESVAKELRVDVRSYRPENGESWEDVQRRAHRFLDDIVLRFPLMMKRAVLLGQSLRPYGESPRVLVVSHGGFIKEVLNIVRGYPGARNDKQNTSMTTIEIAGIPQSIVGALERDKENAHFRDDERMRLRGMRRLRVVVQDDVSHLKSLSEPSASSSSSSSSASSSAGGTLEPLSVDELATHFMTE